MPFCVFILSVSLLIAFARFCNADLLGSVFCLTVVHVFTVVSLQLCVLLLQSFVSIKTMAPNTHVKRAFKAMNDLGITDAQVKPVLKNLLTLYDKNWELIAEDNYRVLADAIFDSQESQVSLPFLSH